MRLQNVSAEVTQDERILAALAHASVLLPLWGLIGAIIVWAAQREKSRFVGFQALQAAAYQLVLIVGAFLGGGCYLCSFLGVFLLMPLGLFAVEGIGDPHAAEGLLAIVIALLTAFLPFLVIGIFFLIGAAFVLYGLYGAVRVLQGHDFRYVLVGRWLERYLSGEPAATG